MIIWVPRTKTSRAVDEFVITIGICMPVKSTFETHIDLDKDFCYYIYLQPAAPAPEQAEGLLSHTIFGSQVTVASTSWLIFRELKLTPNRILSTYII